MSLRWKMSKYKIRVTQRQKRVLDCLLKEGLSQSQTAKKIGMSPSNVSVVISRLCKKHPQLNFAMFQRRNHLYEIPDKYVWEDKTSSK